MCMQLASGHWFLFNSAICRSAQFPICTAMPAPQPIDHGQINKLSHGKMENHEREEKKKKQKKTNEHLFCLKAIKFEISFCRSRVPQPDYIQHIFQIVSSILRAFSCLIPFEYWPSVSSKVSKIDVRILHCLMCIAMVAALVLPSSPPPPLTKVFCYAARFWLTIKMYIEFITIEVTKRFAYAYA